MQKEHFFEYLSLVSQKRHTSYAKRQLCIIDPNNTPPLKLAGKEDWELHQCSNAFKGAFVYADTYTMFSRPDLQQKCHLDTVIHQDNQRAFIMFYKGAWTRSSLSIPIIDIANRNTSVDLWVRTSLEEQLAKTVIGSTAPSLKVKVHPHDSRFAYNEGIHAFLMTMEDPILNIIRKITSMSVISYDAMDIDKSRYFVPFHDLKYVDVASLFTTPSMDGLRVRCMTFDNCIWSTQPTQSSTNTSSLSIELAGFYSQWFKINPTLIDQSQKRYASFTQVKKNKLDHIQSDAKVIQKDDINGLMVIKTKARDSLPQEIPFVHNSHDGTFENAYKTELKSSITKTLSIDLNKVVITVQGVPQAYSHVFFSDMQRMGDVLSNFEGNATVAIWFVDRIERDKVLKGHKYICTTDTSKEYDFQCDEKKGHIWDRPCEHDFECPFYDITRGRGGCGDGGFCEMPLGVNRKGFRKYDEGSNAFCIDRNIHNCDTKDPTQIAFALGDLQNIML